MHSIGFSTPSDVSAMPTKRRLPRWFQRFVAYPLEALVLYAAFGVLRSLPVDWASALGGAAARSVGPRLPVSERARRHLAMALPALSESEQERIVRGMWDNLGRVAGEHPHLDRVWRDRVEVVGGEHLAAVVASGRPCLMFSAHLGNWELLPQGGERFGLPLTAVYRRPNNHLLDPLVRHGRGVQAGELVPKGKEGARAVIQALAKGRSVAMLVDQKMNDGISVPFFGQPAMTAPAVALLAYRFGCPILPVRCERTGGTAFRIIVSPPLEILETGDRKRDIQSLMANINKIVETWIKNRPEQWLWIHRRWSK